MSATPIEALPTELLHKIFSYVTNIDDHREPTTLIRNIRLVSQRFKQIGSALLFQKLTVHISSRSLSQFEVICQHPEFRKFVSQVTINTSYYNVHLAQDRRHFGNHCASTFNQLLDHAERFTVPRRPFTSRGNGNDEKDEVLFNERWHELCRIPYQLRQFGNSAFDLASATQPQKILARMYEEYVRRTNDQENARLRDQHIQRLCEAMKNLPTLQHLEFIDKPKSSFNGTSKYLQAWDIRLDEPGLFAFALSPSEWNGSYFTAFTTKPPVEMFGELLSHLGQTNIRLRKLHVRLGLPVDLTLMEIDERQSHGIRHLMSRSSEIDVNFVNWARGIFYADDNGCCRDEMLTLGPLTKALANSPDLRSIKLTFRQYPVFGQFPSGSLSDFLPLKSSKWSRLESIELANLPCDLDDLSTLVQICRCLLRKLSMCTMFLRTGDWNEAIDVLRKLELLETVELRTPRGGRYGSIGSGANFPQEKAEEYILKTISDNPLQALL